MLNPTRRYFACFASPAWLWFLIVFLISGARVYELGLGLDPSLYASISRTFSREWVWWSLRASDTVFPQYFEHPFLPYWIQGIFFHFFGASDYTTRIPGLILGAGTFYFLYRTAERLLDRRFAEIFCFLTLFSVYFIGRFPSLYLEISLFFCMIASFHFLLKVLDDEGSGWDATLSGLFLGLAFLVKGMAALPMLGSIALYSLYRRKQRFFLDGKLWWGFAVCLFVVLGFLFLQESYGTYSFIRNYLRISMFQKVLPPGKRLFPPGFVWNFFSTHPIHLILAFLGIGYFCKHRTHGRVFWWGLISSVVFVLASASQGKHHLHYYYCNYPMINVLAALFLYEVGSLWKFKWERFAVGFATVYVVIWHFLPIHMRRLPSSEYFMYSGFIRQVKSTGISRLESIGISQYDWIYRQMSLWYWDIDTTVRNDLSEIEGRILVVPQDHPEKSALAAVQFLPCAGGAQYQIWVKGEELSSLCQKMEFRRDWIR